MSETTTATKPTPGDVLRASVGEALFNALVLAPDREREALIAALDRYEAAHPRLALRPLRGLLGNLLDAIHEAQEFATFG